MARTRKASATAKEPGPGLRRKDNAGRLTRQRARNLPDAASHIMKYYGWSSSVPLNLYSIPDTIDKAPRDLKFIATIAIYSSPDRMLSLDEIYAALMDRFTYYRNTMNTIDNDESQKWRGSIRHSLSLFKPFRRVRRDANERGRGDLWTIDVTFTDPFGKKRSTKRNSRRVSDVGDSSSSETETSSSPEPGPSPSSEHDELPLFTYEPRVSGIPMPGTEYHGYRYPGLLFHNLNFPFIPQIDVAVQSSFPSTTYLAADSYTDEDLAIQEYFDLTAYLGSHSSVFAPFF